MIQISGDFLRQGRREWRSRFKKSCGVSCFVWGGVGCSWVVCCLFASRCGDCWFVVCVGLRGYGSWCGARHPQPRSGGHFLVLGSLLSVGVSLAWVAPPPSPGGGPTRFSVLVRDTVRDGVCVAVSLAPWMPVSRGVCVVGLTGFEPGTL